MSTPPPQTLTLQQAFNLALSHQSSGNLSEAENIYRQILQADPNQPEVLLNLGVISGQAGQFDVACDFLKQAIALSPNSALARFNYGNALRELGRLDEAAESFKKALVINPGHAEAHNNLGNVLRELDQLDGAADSFAKAIEANPNHAVAHNNLGNVLQDLGKPDAAIDAYQKALQIQPDYAEPLYNIGICQLLLGQYRQGWQGYSHRFDVGMSQLKEAPQPLWDGQTAAGKSLYLYQEQGIGDEVMFASCLPDVQALPFKRVVVECDPRLVPIFARSFPKCEFVGAGTTNAIPEDFDVQCPTGTLAGLFRNQRADFPGRRGFLKPDPKQVAFWASRFKDLPGSKTIGISWFGGQKKHQQLRRSISLETFLPFFGLDVNVVSLQYGNHAEEIENFVSEHQVQLHQWADCDPLQDLDAFFAQIAALDLVISIDNSTVHFSGSLGVETFAMLPFVPDWRWLLKSSETAWYPSLRLYRCDSHNAWDKVIDLIVSDMGRGEQT
ncbi:tetratricopeptide repeat protein [Magnetovibrio sp. PR-2]|uniref:tetratricopeptide repeat protein n=1 Tax=Magnetovibrio sp. PR-2 TaxID=3120356 RepID=UPI002FCE48ED